MKTNVEKLQTEREKLQNQYESLESISKRSYQQYECGDFIPYFLTQAFLMAAGEAFENIAEKGTDFNPFKNKVPKTIYKGVMYATAGISAALIAAGTLPFAALETPVALANSAFEGIKEIDRNSYNSKTYKAGKKLPIIEGKIKQIDEQIAELSSPQTTR